MVFDRAWYSLLTRIFTDYNIVGRGIVHVSKLSDLPPAINGIIMLADNTEYVIMNKIATDGRVKMQPNSRIRWY